MALPPIISNLPFMKIFKAQRDDAAPVEKTNTQAAQKTGGPRDTLDISASSRRSLEGVQTLASESEAQGIAARTRELLGQADISLGLDPRFT